MGDGAAVTGEEGISSSFKITGGRGVVGDSECSARMEGREGETLSVGVLADGEVGEGGGRCRRVGREGFSRGTRTVGSDPEGLASHSDGALHPVWGGGDDGAEENRLESAGASHSEGGVHVESLGRDRR